MFYFLISAIIFLAAPVYAMRWMNSPQYFNFINVYWLLQCFLILPAAVFLALGLSELQIEVLAVLRGSVIEAISTFLAWYGIMNIFVVIGLRTMAPPAIRFRSFQDTPRASRSPAAHLLAAWILALLAGALFMFKVNQIGGLNFLFANISNRVTLQQGLGPIGILQEAALWVAILFSCQVVALDRVKPSWKLSFFLILGLACITTSIFGGRKAALQYVIGSLAIISFLKPDFFRISLQNTLKIFSLILALLMFFFTTQAYRNTNDLAQFSESIPEIIADGIGATSDIFMSLSYLDTYIFATQHYNAQNRHYGRTFLDLRTAFLPSALVVDKPPVDEGLYVRAATLGHRVEIGSPAWVYDHNSWPPETFGAAMMNFGPLGLPLFGFVLGAVLGMALKYLNAGRGSNFALLLTVNIYLNFELSNLRVVNFVTFAIAVAVFLMMSRMLPSGAAPKMKRLPA